MTPRRSSQIGLATILVGCFLMQVFTASAQTGLQLVPPENVPLNGTFYLLSQEESESPVPPCPIDPYCGSQPVYLLDPDYGIYLIADTPESYAALLEAATQGGMFTMEDEDPPPPPGGGGTNEWTFEYTDTNGQYVSLTNATYNTCIDRDGDGYIRTSAGLADILPWSNVRDGVYGVDTGGGVSTAEDEAITEYVRVPCTGTRTVAVDKFNDIWVGGHEGERIHLKINGLIGESVPDSAFAAYAGGYGGVVDSCGNLWSTGSSSENVVWLVPPTDFPVQSTNWQVLSAPSLGSGYGIAVDTNGVWLGNVQVGEHPTGVSVDSFGKIWAANLASNNAVRIDPNAGEMIVTNGITNYVGAADMYVDLGDGSASGPHQWPYDVAAWPYNYSDMTGFNTGPHVRARFSS